MSNHVQNGTNGLHQYFDIKDMPHIIKPLDRRQKVSSDILQLIGSTSIVKLNRIPQEEGLQCDMYAKCEYLNPGGSIKDRIAYRMVIDAEQRGVLQPGKSVIIEPTSGNTGIGLALAATVKGYRCIIVLPDKMSDEKVNTLRVLGAEIVRTPTDVPSSSPESNISVAARLAKEIPGGIVLDQYDNPCNPLAHYDGTAEEILWSFDDDIDMVVIGAGTSGTVSGVGHKIKERCPKCRIVGVDPYGSILAAPPEINKSDVTYYEVFPPQQPPPTAVEGVGYDFLPKVLDRSVVDEWVKTNDKDAFAMSRRLIREEGLLAGGSAGCVTWAACQAARSLKPGQKCLVLLPDSIRNYMTKFVSDQWMEARDFKSIEPRPSLWWWDSKVPESLVQPTPSINVGRSLVEALAKLQQSKAPLIILEDDERSAVGVLTADHARQRLANLLNTAADPLAKFAIKKFYRVQLDDPAPPSLGRVSRLLDIAPYVLVYKQDSLSKQRPIGVITSDDLIMYVSQKNPKNSH